MGLENTLSNTAIKKKNKSITARNRRIGYAFLLPNLIGFTIFTLLPVVAGLALCFVEWDSSNPMKFVGLQNFARLFKDSTFKISLWNTLYYTVGNVPATMVISLMLAILLNKGIKGVKTFRAAFFFPYISSLVAVAVVWNMLFNPTMGPINSALRALGITNPPGWTTSIQWAMPSVIIVSIWKQVGYYMIIYLAGLQAIPGELYEAATIDGASSFRKFWNITVPMLTPTTFFASIMLIISSFKVFDLVLMMTDGGPGRATNVLVYHIYNQAFINFKFGYSSAMAMVLFLIVLAITVFQFKLEEKWVNYM